METDELDNIDFDCPLCFAFYLAVELCEDPKQESAIQSEWRAHLKQHSAPDSISFLSWPNLMPTGPGRAGLN